MTIAFLFMHFTAKIVVLFDLFCSTKVRLFHKPANNQKKDDQFRSKSGLATVKFLYTTVKKLYTFCKMLFLYFIGFLMICVSDTAMAMLLGRKIIKL